MSPFFSKEKHNDEWFLPEDTRKVLLEHFGQLTEPVELEAYTKKGENEAYGEYMLRFVRDLARLSDLIHLSEYASDSDQAKKRDVSRAPTLLVSPEKYAIRFTGAPLGEEARALIQSITLASLGQSLLSDNAKSILAELDGERAVQVYVNPSCPYCPGQFLNAVKCAVERPGLVSAESVETGENQDLAEKHNVGSVPHTVINETFNSVGFMPEERFVMELVTLRDAEELLAEQRKNRVPEVSPDALDVVIVGAGPGGLSAAIYTVRSGLKTVVLEKNVIGGQVAITPVVENYPGFANVPGKRLMDIMADHAREYCRINEGEEVHSITEADDGRFKVVTDKTAYMTRAVILATGATYKKLGVPGEERFFGHGVNYCASCDGYLYKGKKVVIVGGGNTALTDALHLKNLGVDVTIVHRRDSFRAEKRLQETVEREHIHVYWDTEVTEVHGEEGKVTHVTLQNTQSGNSEPFHCDGMFVAIGYTPHTELAKGLGLEIDNTGYVVVDRGMRTSKPGIYSCGDVIGGVQQIATAIGEGSTAALSAFEDLQNPYWSAS